MAAETPRPSTAGGTINPDQRAGKYLIFQVGSEEFGVGVHQVLQIMGLQEITLVPHTPPHVKGVINLRGKVVPIVDLRLKFGLPAQPYNSRTCIMIVRIRQAGEDVTVGAIVDSVAEVLTLTSADIEDTPDFGAGIATPYLMGLGKVKGKVKILLYIDEVLNTEDLHGVNLLLEQPFSGRSSGAARQAP